MDDSEQRWNKLVKAAKPALDDNDAPPPQEFGNRIAKLRHSIRALALAMTWKRWSILAAILAALMLGIVYWIVSREDAERPPIIQPEPPTHPTAS